jgi:hypothetical protein
MSKAADASPDAVETPGPVCGNCKSALYGPYCHFCGQRERSPVRELWHVLRDSADEFLALDGKLWRSLLPLYFRPGRLTQRYLEGERVQFIKPLRMYLALSVILFLVMSWQTRIEPAKPGEVTSGISVDFSDADRANFAKSKMIDIDWHGKPWNAITNPIDLAWLPAFADHWLNSTLVHIENSKMRIAQEPGLLATAIYRTLPTAIFLLLPFAALLLKVLYFFKRRLFAEHLLFAIQCHSFVFLSFILLFLLGRIGTWFVGANAAMAPILGLPLVLVTFWIPLNLFLSIKRVYQQGWWLSAFKFGAFALSYGALLVIAFAGAFLASLASV